MDYRTDEIIARIEELSTISDSKECLSRYFGTNAHNKASRLLIKWMNEAGLQVTYDNIGNVRGVLHSTNKNAKYLVIGSHYDTVFNAGKYDGPLGLIMGIEIAKKCIENQKELPFHLMIAGFTDEEGGRFNTAYLGSSVLAGSFDKNWLTRKDKDGITLEEVIKEAIGNPSKIDGDAIPAEDWLGYFEIHIEQGPVLCETCQPVCLVSSIASQTRIEICWEGIAGHAGTSPMNLRSDALCAAADFISTIENLGQSHQEKLVATVGKLNVLPNSSNVIPGFVYHSIDIRSEDEAFLNQMVEELETKGKEIAAKRNIKFSWKLMQTNPAVRCDNQLNIALQKSIQQAGIDSSLAIVSGAGHDGVMISKVAPISMLFVRCKEGVSHNPAEFTEPEDIKAALAVCDNYINELTTLFQE